MGRLLGEIDGISDRGDRDGDPVGIVGLCCNFCWSDPWPAATTKTNEKKNQLVAWTGSRKPRWLFRGTAGCWVAGWLGRRIQMRGHGWKRRGFSRRHGILGRCRHHCCRHKGGNDQLDLHLQQAKLPLKRIKLRFDLVTGRHWDQCHGLRPIRME